MNMKWTQMVSISHNHRTRFPHYNVSMFVIVNFAIKLYGVYPYKVWTQNIPLQLVKCPRTTNIFVLYKCFISVMHATTFGYYYLSNVCYTSNYLVYVSEGDSQVFFITCLPSYMVYAYPTSLTIDLCNS